MGREKADGGVRTLFGSRFGTAAAFPVFSFGRRGRPIPSKGKGSRGWFFRTGRREGTITSATENLSGNGRQGCRWTGKERERERRNGKKEGRMNEWRERTTQREREKERGKKKISPRGGRGDWHSRLVKLRWPRMENEVFDHAWKGDGRAEWSERERESSYRAWSVNLNGKYKK